MKYKTSIFLLLLCFFILEKIKAQGGRSAGLANSNVTIQDESSVFNNIAGIASQKTLCGILSFENKYTNTAFNTASAAVVIPSKLGVGSFDIKRFGNNLYNENKIGLGFSHQIQSVSIGLKTSYQQYYIQEYGTKGLFLFEFGGIATIIPKLSFGAHIYNFSKARLSKEAGEKLPVRMKVGLGFLASDKLLLLCEVEKIEDRDPCAKGGIEYKILKSLTLRTGAGTNPINTAFGFGLILKQFKIDYALSSYQKLGFQNSFSLSYSIRKK